MSWSFPQAVADVERCRREEGLVMACYRERVWVPEAQAIRSALEELDAARAAEDEEAQAEALDLLAGVATYGADAAGMPVGSPFGSRG